MAEHEETATGINPTLSSYRAHQDRHRARPAVINSDTTTTRVRDEALRGLSLHRQSLCVRTARPLDIQKLELAAHQVVTHGRPGPEIGGYGKWTREVDEGSDKLSLMSSPSIRERGVSKVERAIEIRTGT